MGFIFDNKHSGDMGVVFKSTDRTLLPAKRVTQYTIPGKGGTLMNKYAGFCLETQFYPDSPNQPNFPSCIFKAGEKFRSRTSFKFSVK